MRKPALTSLLLLLFAASAYAQQADTVALDYARLDSLLNVRILPGTAKPDAYNYQIVNTHYVKDSAGVYYTEVNDIGSRSAILVRSFYALKDADPATFDTLGGFFTRDSRHVYFKQHLLEGADPARTEVLSEAYSRCGEAIYHHNGLLKGVNAKAFKVFACDVHYDTAVDDLYLYFHGERVRADVKTLHRVDQAHFKDKYYDYEFIIDHGGGHIRKAKRSGKTKGRR